LEKDLKISIIVPVYNAEAFLEECLDSILAQTLKGIEIICINDGSRDNSQAILERYAKKDGRIKVLTKENGGQSSARNLGLKIARGEYIGFVDSDDFIVPDMMEKLYVRAKETDADISIGDVYLYNNDTHEKDEFRDQLLYLRLKNKVVTLEDEPQLVSCIAVWDRICKRSLLTENNIRFAEGLVYEDHLYTIEELVKAKRVVLTPEKLYYYRKFGGASTTDQEVKNDRFKSNYLEIHRRIQTVLRKSDSSEEVSFEYLRYFMQNAFMHQENATTLKFFKSFFWEMREMMNDRAYELVEKFDSPGWTRYAKWLKRDQPMRCWMYFKLRNLARRVRKRKREREKSCGKS